MFLLHHLVSLLASVALLCAAASAWSAKLPICTGRFVAHQGSPLVAGSTVATDTVAIEGARPRFTVGLGGCPKIRARLKGTKAGITKVGASWKKNKCGIPAKVTLKGTILPGCHILTGTVKAGTTSVPFTAPSCGDAVVDGDNGEACEDASDCDAGGACVDCQCTGRIGRTVNFAVDVQPILSASCVGAGCHSGQFPAQGIDLSSGAAAYTALTSKTSTEAPCTGTKLVIPGSPDASVLVKKLTGTSCGFSRMPLGRSMLSAVDIDVIRDWIAQGALGGPAATTTTVSTNTSLATTTSITTTTGAAPTTASITTTTGTVATSTSTTSTMLVSLPADVQMILNARCAVSGCHVPPVNAGALDLSAGTAYGQLVDFITHTDRCPLPTGVKRVDPGSTGTSYLIEKLKGAGPCFTLGKMPLVPPALTPAELATLIGWVEQGVPSN